MNRLIRGALATAGVAAAIPFTTALTAGIALASTGTVPCSNPPTTQYLLPWGDTHQYFLMPGADFQSGDTYPWAMSGGARTTSGGDPWNVVKARQPMSALVPPGGTTTSWTMCMTSSQTWVRFFYKSPDVTNSSLHVYVKVTAGVNVAINTVDISGNTAGWALANILNLPAMYGSNGQEDVSISFWPTNTLATWQVDDVLIDPFSSR